MDEMLNTLSASEAMPNVQFRILGSTRRGWLLAKTNF